MKEYDYSKKCILTPTFIGHFQYLKNYLDSFRKNVEDKEDVIIFFIINFSEKFELRKVIDRYSDLNIEVLFFEDILKRFNIDETPEFLLEKYGKFSFQALKKFYGMLFLEKFEHFLVLDTESIWLNKTKMKELFSNFFVKDPFIIFSSIDKRLGVSLSNLEASDNINFILNQNCQKWFVEQYCRFWDVKILKDIFVKHGSCFEIVKKIYEKEINFLPKLGLFESVLYDQWVYSNNIKYGYKLVDLDKECEKYLEKDVFFTYRKNMNKIFNGSCGLLESSSLLLDKFNYKGFADVFRKNNLNVIRIETELQNYKWQKLFLDIVKPNILTCSQENFFGVNKNIKNLIRFFEFKSRRWLKLKKRVCFLYYPIKKIFNWVVTLLRLPIDLFRFLVELIDNIIFFYGEGNFSLVFESYSKSWRG